MTPIRLLPFVVSFSTTCTFFINVCGWLFACGCRALWAGADAACNIHLAQSRHCPICSHGRAGYALIMTLVCAPQLAASLLPRWGLLVRMLVCLALFPSTMIGVGLLLGWAEGYWSHILN
jgi:hypothetical protein